MTTPDKLQAVLNGSVTVHLATIPWPTSTSEVCICFPAGKSEHYLLTRDGVEVFQNQIYVSLEVARELVKALEVLPEQ